MACNQCTNGNRCPRCGRYLRNQRKNSRWNRSETRAREREEVLEDDCCIPCDRPIGQELYAGTAEPVLYVTCYDSKCGLQKFRADQRNPFWPSFAHPRWLTCQELYNRHSNCNR